MRSIINTEEEAKVMYPRIWKIHKTRRLSGAEVNGGKYTHKSEGGPELGVVTGSASGYREVGTKHRAHLTVRVHWYEVHDHGHDRSETREGIYLPE